MISDHASGATPTERPPLKMSKHPQPGRLDNLEQLDELTNTAKLAYQTLLVSDRGLTKDEIMTRTGLADGTVKRAKRQLTEHNLITDAIDPRYPNRKIYQITSDQ